MATKKRTADAAELLRRRYIKDDAKRRASEKEERLNAQIAQMIYDQRSEAGLSQKQLADLIGTTQSVISRLEDAEYEGHSMTMLERIAKATHGRLVVQMAARDSEADTMRFVFRQVIRNLRRKKGLTVEQLASKIGVDSREIVALERSALATPKPLLLRRLSKFFDLPERHLAELAGAVKDVPATVREEATRFAAKSDSFKKLTDEEKTVLDEFVKVLKAKA